MRKWAFPAFLVLLLTACRTHVNGLMPTSPSPEDGTIHSLTPILKWEAFPADSISEVSELVYDVKVLRPDGTTFYERDGILTHEHRLEVALESSIHYSWTVRARFKCRGERRMTQWSSFSSNSARRSTLPAAVECYFPLIAPANPAH